MTANFCQSSSTARLAVVSYLLNIAAYALSYHVPPGSGENFILQRMLVMILCPLTSSYTSVYYLITFFSRLVTGDLSFKHTIRTILRLRSPTTFQDAVSAGAVAVLVPPRFHNIAISHYWYRAEFGFVGLKRDQESLPQGHAMRSCVFILKTQSRVRGRLAHQTIHPSSSLIPQIVSLTQLGYNFTQYYLTYSKNIAIAGFASPFVPLIPYMISSGLNFCTNILIPSYGSIFVLTPKDSPGEGTWKDFEQTAGFGEAVPSRSIPDAELEVSHGSDLALDVMPSVGVLSTTSTIDYTSRGGQSSSEGGRNSLSAVTPATRTDPPLTSSLTTAPSAAPPNGSEGPSSMGTISSAPLLPSSSSSSPARLKNLEVPTDDNYNMESSSSGSTGGLGPATNTLFPVLPSSSSLKNESGTGSLVENPRLQVVSTPPSDTVTLSTSAAVVTRAETELRRRRPEPEVNIEYEPEGDKITEEGKQFYAWLKDTYPDVDFENPTSELLSRKYNNRLFWMAASFIQENDVLFLIPIVTFIVIVVKGSVNSHSPQQPRGSAAGSKSFVVLFNVLWIYAGAIVEAIDDLIMAYSNTLRNWRRSLKDRTTVIFWGFDTNLPGVFKRLVQIVFAIAGATVSSRAVYQLSCALSQHST